MKSLRSISWLFLFALLAGCDKPAGQSGDGSGKTYRIAVIPKGTTHEFWKSIHAGAIKAERELRDQGVSVNITWNGPLREDAREEQINIVNNFIVRNFSGIVLAPLDSQALAAPVERAAAGGIPVVIIDSALNSQKPVSYVATDNFKGGQIAAQALGKLLHGQGKVILLRYQEGSASTEQREAGFLDVMTREFPAIALISTNQYAGATRGEARDAALNLLTRFGDQVQGMFAPCEPVTVGILLALDQVKRGGGTVKLVGFDAGAQPVEALKKGEIHALVVQDPVRMGYLGVKTMVEHLQGKTVEKVIDTGVYLVTPENMNQEEIRKLLNPPLDEYLN